MQRPSFALLMLCGALALGLTVADRTSRPKLASKARARSVARVTKASLPKPTALPPAATVPTTIPTAPAPTTISTAPTATLQIASPAVPDTLVATSEGKDRTDTMPSWLLTGDEDPVDAIGSTLADGSRSTLENAALPSNAEVTTAALIPAAATLASATPSDPTATDPTMADPTMAEPTMVGATEAGAGNWSLTAWVVQRFADQRAAVLGVEVQYSIPTVMKRLRDMASVVDRMSESLRRAGVEMFEAATLPAAATQAGG